MPKLRMLVLVGSRQSYCNNKPAHFWPTLHVVVRWLYENQKIYRPTTAWS